MTISRPSIEELQGASKEELAALAADCLAQLEPGRQPLPLFTQISRLSVLSILEVVPFKADSDESPKVFLPRRKPDDPWWPNLLHVPGGVILPDDKCSAPDDYVAPAKRIIREDSDGELVIVGGNIHMVGIRRGTDVRGSAQGSFGWSEVEAASAKTNPASEQYMFDVESVIDGELGTELLEGHREMVEQAFSDYSAVAAPQGS